MFHAKIIVPMIFIIHEDFSKFWNQTSTHNYIIQLIVNSLIKRGTK